MPGRKRKKSGLHGDMATKSQNAENHRRTAETGDGPLMDTMGAAVHL